MAILIPIVVTGEQDLKKLDRSFKRVEKTGEQAFRKINKQGVRLRQSTDGLQRSIGAVRNQLLLFSFATAGAGVVIGKTINLAAALVEAQSRVSVVFGESAKAIEEFAKDSAKSLGASRREVFQMTGEIGNLLRALKFTQKDAANTAINVVKLSADLASFNDLAGGTTEALTAIRSALVGETEPIRRLGSDVRVLRLEQIALNLGLSDGKKALDAQTKAIAALEAITRDTLLAHDDFSETLGISLPNQLRVAQARMEDLNTAIGQRFLPTTIALTGAWNDWLEAVGNADFQGIASGFSGIADAMLNPIKFMIELRRESNRLQEESRAIILGPGSREGIREFLIFQRTQREETEKLRLAAIKAGTAEELRKQALVALDREILGLTFEETVAERLKNDAINEQALIMEDLIIPKHMQRLSILDQELQKLKEENAELGKTPFGNMNKGLELAQGITGQIVQNLAQALAHGEDLGNALKAVAIQIGLSFLPGGGRSLFGFAHGTSFAPGGLAVVGERGPEIVNLPRGSQVIPNNEINNTTNSSTINIILPVATFDEFTVRTKVIPALRDAVENGDDLPASRLR